MEKRTFNKAVSAVKSLVRMAISGQLMKGVDVQTSGDGYAHLVVDISKVYPPLIKGLGGEMDQYWFQVARRVVTNYLSDTYNRPVHVVLTAEDKAKWSYKNQPEGQGELRGREEFHKHYPKGKEILNSIELSEPVALEDI